MTAPILAVRGVGKKFCRHLRRSLLYGVRDMAVELMGRGTPRDRLRSGEFWALDGIDFSIAPGECVGLIGANGSGKTTLLRVISRLIRPDVGSVATRGRIAPLLALGAGFNPILTGRENIQVNLALLGLDAAAIRRRFDEVVAFADIGDAIDAPVRTYSSGMAARLGFACAVHTDPEILLIDEVLSVGDLRFRAKCHNRLAALRRGGTTFVLVSHSPAAVLTLCDSAVYLAKGKVVMRGAVAETLRRYEEDQVPEIPAEAPVAALRGPGDGVAILDIACIGPDGDPGWICGRPARLRVRVRAELPVAEVSINLMVRELMDEMQTVLFLQSRDDLGLSLLPAGEHAIDLSLPACGLRPGPYQLKLNLTSGPEMGILDIKDDVRFRVAPGEPMANSAYYQPRAWSLPGAVGVTPP